MRSMLFLLGGFAVVLLLGFWMADSMVPGETASATAVVGKNASPDRAALWLFALAAWATAFFVRPLWVSVPLMAVVVFLGGLLVVLGALNGYADTHLRPNQSGSWMALHVGVVMLASRVVTFVLWLRKPLAEESK